MREFYIGDSKHKNKNEKHHFISNEISTSKYNM